GRPGRRVRPLSADRPRRRGRRRLLRERRQLSRDSEPGPGGRRRRRCGERLRVRERVVWRVAWAGDADGDDRDDVLVGAPGDDTGGVLAGRAFVYSGPDGALRYTLTGVARDEV